MLKTLLDTFCTLLVFNQVTESMDSGTEVETQDQPANATEPDVQSDATEFTEFVEHLKPSEATEPTYEPEEELEQSTGPSLSDYCKKILPPVVIQQMDKTMGEWYNCKVDLHKTNVVHGFSETLSSGG